MIAECRDNLEVIALDNTDELEFGIDGNQTYTRLCKVLGNMPKGCTGSRRSLSFNVNNGIFNVWIYMTKKSIDGIRSSNRSPRIEVRR